MAAKTTLAQKSDGSWYTLAEMREIALGAARGYLKRMDIDPLEAGLKGLWGALSDLSHSNPDLIASIWYVKAQGRYQTQMFEREARAWAAREREFRNCYGGDK